MADAKTDPIEGEETEEEIEGVDPVDETEDENLDDQQPDEPADDDEGETDEDAEPDDEQEFQRRFTQFKGSNVEEYVKNLEDGYDNSSKEAVRLAQENRSLKDTVDRVNGLIATNPELAQAIQSQPTTQTPPTGITPDQVATNPALAWAQSQMMTTWQQEQNDFISDHPEVGTDPMLADQLNVELGIVRDVVMQREGRLVGMKEGLERAWKMIGKDDTQDDTLRNAVRDTASQGRVAGGKKQAKEKPRFTEAQIETAMEMLNTDRNSAIKSLSEHNNNGE